MSSRKSENFYTINLNPPSRYRHTYAKIDEQRIYKPDLTSSKIDVHSILYQSADEYNLNKSNNELLRNNKNENFNKFHNKLKLYHRFGGSFQNLSGEKLKDNQKTKKMCASESNLINLDKEKSFTLANYCPSVLFNRIQNNSKRNVTIKNNNNGTNWKKFIPKMFRKPRPKSGRE